MENRGLALLSLPSAVWAVEFRTIASRGGTVNIQDNIPNVSASISIIQLSPNTSTKKKLQKLTDHITTGNETNILTS
jgi:hypothetical protein